MEKRAISSPIYVLLCFLQQIESHKQRSFIWTLFISYRKIVLLFHYLMNLSNKSFSSSEKWSKLQLNTTDLATRTALFFLYQLKNSYLIMFFFVFNFVFPIKMWYSNRPVTHFSFIQKYFVQLLVIYNEYLSLNSIRNRMFQKIHLNLR